VRYKHILAELRRHCAGSVFRHVMGVSDRRYPGCEVDWCSSISAQMCLSDAQFDSRPGQKPL
jgi:hypothetical protein